MKTNQLAIILVGLGLCVLGGSSVRSQQETSWASSARELSNKAIQAPAQSHSVLVLFYRIRSDYDATGTNYFYSGATVYASSSSGKAPVFPQYPAVETQIAVAISKAMDAGLHILSFDSGIVSMSD